MTADVDRSKIGRTSRARGADAERSVVAYLRANGWPDARRYLAGDGRQPGDLDWHPLVACEVKDRAGSSWPTWCRQAAAEARPGMIPMVVRRTRGVTDVGLWECRVNAASWGHAANFAPINQPPTLFAVVDRNPWIVTTFAAVVAAVARLDAPSWTPEDER